MTDKHIFISYRSVEREFAKVIAQALAERGYPIWMDRLGGIKPGDNWEDSLKAGVNGSFAMVAMLSRNYLESEWCKREVQSASAQDVMLFPVKIGEYDQTDLWLALQSKQHVTLNSATDAAHIAAVADELAKGIAANTGVQPGDPHTLAMDENKALYRSDPEDNIDKAIEEAKAKEAGDPFAALEAEALRQDLEMLMTQFKAVAEQHRTILDGGLAVKLAAQKTTLRDKAKAIQDQLRALES